MKKIHLRNTPQLDLITLDTAYRKLVMPWSLNMDQFINREKTIKYLAKFVREDEHAEQLLDGELFMHTAYYYQDLERKKGAGQGDLGEASLFPNVCMYKNNHMPIYCMSLVEISELNPEIAFERRIIQDFDCENGFVVLIEYEPFIRILEETVRNGIQFKHGIVQYGEPSSTLSLQLLAKSVVDNLFIKRHYFHYQNEYRIVLCDDYSDEEFSCIKSGVEFFKVFSLANNLRGIANKISISALKTRDDNIIISV